MVWAKYLLCWGKGKALKSKVTSFSLTVLFSNNSGPWSAACDRQDMREIWAAGNIRVSGDWWQCYLAKSVSSRPVTHREVNVWSSRYLQRKKNIYIFVKQTDRDTGGRAQIASSRQRRRVNLKDKVRKEPCFFYLYIY